MYSIAKACWFLYYIPMYRITNACQVLQTPVHTYTVTISIHYKVTIHTYTVTVHTSEHYNTVVQLLLQQLCDTYIQTHPLPFLLYIFIDFIKSMAFLLLGNNLMFLKREGNIHQFIYFSMYVIMSTVTFITIYEVL